MRVFLSLLIIFVLQSGCITADVSNHDESKIVHIVMIWLQEPGNDHHINEVIKATQSLKVIPEVQEIRVGEKVLSERPIVDDSFDVGIYMVFSNNEALDAYLVHPLHLEAVRTVLQPLSSKILVYDFEEPKN